MSIGGSAGSTLADLKLIHVSALNMKHRACDRSGIETGTALGYIWLGSPVIIHSNHISVGHYTTEHSDLVFALWERAHWASVAAVEQWLQQDWDQIMGRLVFAINNSQGTTRKGTPFIWYMVGTHNRRSK
ncbi:unnamed protein product [Phytophthora fragariaefolia]|uniref:Unnamed protein product n=1 Tax=Phytophthora fragariaefolia TaxID=1490495 RepID=A0A9W6TIY1_9STRA|nr:unnamed protein product [Phytophthora fragariaefolia]